MRKPLGEPQSFQPDSAQQRAEKDSGVSVGGAIQPQSIQNDENTEEVIESSGNECEKAFLSNVYLQKSPYKIKDKFVEQIEEPVFQPELLVDALKQFESG